MIGHGSELEGGDKDIAAFEEAEVWATDARYYSLPPYLNTELPGPEAYVEETDLLDGQSDDLWRGHEIAPLDATPAFAKFENEAIKAIVSREGMGADELTDLFYINYKSPDMAGHQWNMINPEQKGRSQVGRRCPSRARVLPGRAGRLRRVRAGRSRQITARRLSRPEDGRSTRTRSSRTWPQTFDKTGNGLGLIERTSPTVMFVNRIELEANDVTPEEARRLSDRIHDRGERGTDATTTPCPRSSSTGPNDPVFSAVYPGGRDHRGP